MFQNNYDTRTCYSDDTKHTIDNKRQTFFSPDLQGKLTDDSEKMTLFCPKNLQNKATWGKQFCLKPMTTNHTNNKLNICSQYLCVEMLL